MRPPGPTPPFPFSAGDDEFWWFDGCVEPFARSASPTRPLSVGPSRQLVERAKNEEENEVTLNCEQINLIF